MAVKPLLLFPDGQLSTPSAVVEHFDAAFLSLVKDLWDTLSASPGVGLAAPQIGVLQRVSVIDVTRAAGKKKKVQEGNHGAFVLVNPVIISRRGVQMPREGCLSVPDILANVERSLEIAVRFQNEHGEEKAMTAAGFEALALQHEIDHLDGKLFLDRVANLKTDLFRRQQY